MKIKVYDWVRNNKIVSLLIPLVAVAIIVWTVYSNSNWIGFWGSIIGSFFGVVGVFATMRLDQKKREEERRQDIFLSNKEIYVDLLTILKLSKIRDIALGLNELKQNRDWHSLDRDTKNQVVNILSERNKVDEYEGLKNALSIYVLNEFDSIFTEKYAKRIDDQENKEPVFIEDHSLANDAVQDLVIWLYSKIGNNPESLDEIEDIFKSEHFFKDYMLLSAQLRRFASYSDDIYYTMLSFFESSIWKDYLKNREETFHRIDSLKNSIEAMLEEIHT